MIKNEYKITRELIKRWAKEDRFGNSTNILIFVLYTFVGIIGVTMLCLLVAFGGDAFNWYFAFFFVLFSVFRLTFVPYHAWTSRYKMMSKTYGVSEWIRATELSDEEITVTDHTSVTKMKYENIKKIKEKDNEVTIFFNNRLVLILYKDAFKKGTWEECRALLDSKIKITD